MRKFLFVACIASIALAAPGAGWPDDCFLSLAGIGGDVSIGHPPTQSFALLGWSWPPVDQKSPAPSGAYPGEKKTMVVPEVGFLKRIGAPSSVDLQKSLHSGTGIREGMLACYQSYGRGDAYLKLRFGDVRIIDMQTRYVPGQNPTPIEEVTIGFSHIVVDAAPIRPDGSLGSYVSFGWDSRRNRPFGGSSPPPTTPTPIK